MNDTRKMLRAIINGQSALKQELLAKIGTVDKKVDAVDKKVDKLRSEMKQEFKKTNDRIDKIGKTVAYLEDDTPTREEHDSLDKRLTVIEQKVASA